MQNILNPKHDAAIGLLDRLANDPRLLVAFQREGLSFFDQRSLAQEARDLLLGSAAPAGPTQYVATPVWIAAPALADNRVAAPFVGVPYIAAPFVAAALV